MNIISKSLIVINRDSQTIQSREIPAKFDTFVNTLIAYINSNDNVKEYQSTSLTSQVVSCALTISLSPDNSEVKNLQMNDIAQRLLHKELTAEQQSRNLNCNIQKGSLIQSLLYDDCNEKYFYLLAKVEHVSFFDDADFSLKAGFSEDDNKIWKTCLLDLEHSNNVVRAKVYSNTGAKYWNHEFLELVEITTDEVNTERAFKNIENVLSRKIKKESPHDYVVVRNKIIAYFRSKDFIDYDSLMNDLSTYIPDAYPIDKFKETITILKKLPKEKNFDSQFNAVPSAIKARIKTSYNVNRGIVLKVDGEIDNLEQTIFSYRKHDGEQYIVIKTNNNELFNTYLIDPQN